MALSVLLALLAVASPGKFLRPGAPPVDAESLHSYDVRHYRLDFDLPMNRAGYACREEVSITSNRPQLDTVPLDFAGLVCDSVRRLGARLVFDTAAGRLNVALDAPLPGGDSTVIEIFFRRLDGTSQLGYYFGQPPSIRYAHAMTCGCPTDNHYWFACWDQPSDKADRGVMLNLTVPDTFQTVSVGLCDSVTDNGNGTSTWWWRHPYPIDAYLMTFSASRFAAWDSAFVNTGGDTVPLQFRTWPEDLATARNGWRRLPEMIEYYIRPDIYGSYPFDKFGQVPGYYGFPWGGMEHQTLVMLSPSYINGNDVTVAHELSHMWWGDMVTHVGYADVWLNEGFATYSECICMGALNGRNYFRTLVNARASSYISRDRSYRMPVYNPPWNLIYDYGHIYCKGALVQHMLRWVMGDTAFDSPGVFFEMMRAYGDSFRFGTASTDDYCRIASQFHGEDLSWFFDEWIYQAGYPKYHLDWTREPAGDSFRVVTTLAQGNGNQAPDFFRTPLPVRVMGAGAEMMVTIRPQANPQVDTFLCAVSPESLKVDPDNWVLDSCYLTGIAEPGGEQLQGAPRLVARPSPARDAVRFSLPPHATALEVLDPAGRVVATLACAGGTLAWDRRDNAGRRLAAGVYYARVAGRGAGPHCRLVLAD